MLTYPSEEALDSCRWAAQDLNNKSNVQLAVKKSDNHAFFRI